MSLSEHEKTEFERITAGLSLGDTVALKEMERRDKAASKGATPRPHLKVWAITLIWFGLALIAAAFFYAQTGSILHAFLILVFVWVFMMATEYAGNPRRNRNRS